MPRPLLVLLLLVSAATAQTPCEWVDVGGGVTTPVPGLPTPWPGLAWVRTLATFDAGAGPSLYAGGRFATAGGTAATLFARWDGTSWSDVGGYGGPAFGQPSPSDLEVHDDGTGPRLYASTEGSFGFPPAGLPAGRRVLRYDGAGWSTVGSGLFAYPVHDLLDSTDPGTPGLLAAVTTTSTGPAPPSGVMRWDGTSWSGLGSIPGCRCLVAWDEGAGPRIHAVTEAGFLFRWDGPLGWTSLTFLAGIRDLEAYDDGTGPSLYACGTFQSAGAFNVGMIARWTGVLWLPAGAGLSGGVAETMQVRDDGTGPRLVVGGSFQWAGNGPARCVAAWDGATWQPLGAGLQGPVAPDTGGVLAVAGFQGDLHVGGEFYMSGSGPQNHVARWTGVGCSPSVQVIRDGNGAATSLTVADGGLVPGRTYRNLISVPIISTVGIPSPSSSCAVPGTGPILGLCFPDPGLLWWQALMPATTPPFHFVATAPFMTFGPFPTGPPTSSVYVTFDVVCLDVTGGVIGSASTVARVRVVM